METSVEQDVELWHGGNVLRARYRVEDGVIQVDIDGKIIRSPVGLVAPADTVRAMVLGYILKRYGAIPARTSETSGLSP
jgi:hypothetical protein